MVSNGLIRFQYEFMVLKDDLGHPHDLGNHHITYLEMEMYILGRVPSDLTPIYYPIITGF